MSFTTYIRKRAAQDEVVKAAMTYVGAKHEECERRALIELIRACRKLKQLDH